MTIQECYQAMGGDYSQVVIRLPSESIIRKFIAKFPEDDSYPHLLQAMEAGNREEAILAAHALKGVSGNLGFARLYASSSLLTEKLRMDSARISQEEISLLEEVTRSYNVTVTAIARYLDNQESPFPWTR